MNAITKTKIVTSGTIHEVAACNLNCPHPTMQLKITLNSPQVKIGDTVRVLTDDPASVDDIELLCRQLKSKLEFLGTTATVANMAKIYAIYVKKTG